MSFDANASVMHAHAVNEAARAQRHFTMVNFNGDGSLAYRIPFKTRGQSAYERDLAVSPLYVDGGTRKTWEQLSRIAQDSWERNPTDRS